MTTVSEPASREPRHVLVAEDDEEMRKLLSWSMTREGFTVTECRDGTELLGKLGLLAPHASASPFDVIVSDIRMPGSTGLEALGAVREFEGLPPVIFISAFADATAREQAERLGAAGVLAKPFDTDELIRWVRRLAPPATHAPGGPDGVAERRLAPFPVDVTFRHGPGGDVVTSFVEEMAAKLAASSDGIRRCRVVIEGWSPGSPHPRRSHVRIRIRTDSGVIVAHSGHGHHDRDSVYLAIRLAFANAGRRLRRHFRKARDHRPRPEDGEVFERGEDGEY